jgi:opacity protein-like surface antigen
MVLGVLGLAGTLASPAFAKDEFTGFRLQASVGSETQNSDLTDVALGSTEPADNNRFTYSFGAGWALNKFLAVELSLRSGSEYNSTHFERVLTQPEDYRASHLDLSGFEGSIVGSLWLNDHISFYGRAGMFGWNAEELFTVGNDATQIRPASKLVHKASDTGFDPLFGVGVQTVLDGALMRIEYRYTEIGDLSKAGVFTLTNNSFSSLEFSIVWTL